MLTILKIYGIYYGVNRLIKEWNSFRSPKSMSLQDFILISNMKKAQMR